MVSHIKTIINKIITVTIMVLSSQRLRQIEELVLSILHRTRHRKATLWAWLGALLACTMPWLSRCQVVAVKTRDGAVGSMALLYLLGQQTARWIKVKPTIASPILEAFSARRAKVAVAQAIRVEGLQQVVSFAITRTKFHRNSQRTGHRRGHQRRRRREKVIINLRFGMIMQWLRLITSFTTRT